MSYSITRRQINKVKGYDITYFKPDREAVSLGFVKTMKEVKEIIEKNKKARTVCGL